MAVYCNPLENEEDIQKYKEWLNSKDTRFLKHLIKVFNLPLEYQITIYPNLPLRINLVEEELSKRLN